MHTHFTPGLRFYEVASHDADETTSNFPYSISRKSVLDLALISIAPAGLGPLAPLWQILHGFVKRQANFDITFITRKALVVFGAAIGLRLVWDATKPLVLASLCSSKHWPVEHITARRIQKWLQDQDGGGAKRHMKYTAEREIFNPRTQALEVVGDERTDISGGLFFFENKPLYFEFQNNGKAEQAVVNKNGEETGVKVYGDEVFVYSLDRSGSLIKRFVDHLSTEDVNATQVTPLFRIAPDSGNYSYHTKPIRPFSTIDLDAKIKSVLINDIDRFFSPNRAQWYAARGIPYKRGFLLEGPPGTGKSSISRAIAGHIGGALYTIAIGEVMDETHLISLIMDVKKDSVLLLEDIDSAGLSRENLRQQAEDEGRSKYSNRRRNPISLSGLLNALDALEEGVILIMTTNAPETLDKALIRPGRIDRQIHVGNASQVVAESIFRRFYRDEDTASGTDARIAELAAAFAGKIPDLELTPAEIQGFLIKMSDDPEGAVRDVGALVSEVMAARETGVSVGGRAEAAQGGNSGSDGESSE